MEFNSFKKAVQKQFSKMIKDNDELFLTGVSRDLLWGTYLESFPEGYNLIYKERGEYDCQSCKQFIRPFANIVSIKNNKRVSIWDIPGLETPFKEVCKAMAELVTSAPIKNVFITKKTKLGIDKNHHQLEDGSIETWEHFYYELPKSFVNTSGKSIESVQAKYRDSKNVFERSMRELTIEAGEIILDLISQNSLYRGEESKGAVEKFLHYKKEFANIGNSKRDNWCWIYSFNNPVSRIRNTALGTLLIDLSKDMEVDEAVRKFEAVMAPVNYKRPKPIFTKKMIENAEKKIEELGFDGSLKRRFAVLKDVTVNNILFVNRDARKKLKNSVFDDLKEDVPVKTKAFDKVEEVGIETFVKDILPGTKSIELVMENKHINNLMSVIAPGVKDSRSMFKWDNNFSWAYNGDITDSIKQNVKKAGGNVEGVLRFSIQWNDNRDNNNDFDAHCLEPNGNLIYYQSKVNLRTTGNLDVDITQPMRQVPGGPAVENITWTAKHLMLEGNYKFMVHNYSHNGGRSGFSAEIEYDGQIYSFEYDKELRPNETISVADIIFNKEDGIKFIKSLDSTTSSKEVWGVKTNKFSKVSICMYSPNYWDDQDAIGNRHYFFLLDGCKNETRPRGFFNEFLNQKLTEHRKVFEALGSKMRVDDCEEQLSGLGFSSTQRNSVLARIEGTLTRTIKIIF